MSGSQRISVVLVVGAMSVLFGPVATSWALSLSMPRSYEHVTEGGEYVLVMVAPPDQRRTPFRSRTTTEPVPTPVRLEAKYEQCGLYRNDGSAEPLWTIEYALLPSYIPAADGVHMVRRGDTFGSASSLRAVAFYRNGKKFKSYSVGDLVKHPDAFVVDYGSKVMEWVQRQRLDNASQTYVIETKEFKRYVFDITTGAILSTEDMDGSEAWASAHRDCAASFMRAWGYILGGMVIALVVVLYLLLRRRRNRLPADDQGAV